MKRTKPFIRLLNHISLLIEEQHFCASPLSEEAFISVLLQHIKIYYERKKDD